MKKLAVILTMFSLVCTVTASAPYISINDYITDFGLTPYYAQTTWPTGHRDSRNSGFVPLVTPTALNSLPKWTALDGATVLGAVTIGPEGHLYATTGKEAGHANLHAFDREGQPLWSSNLPDSAAVASSPVVDAKGDLYLSDSDQFWAFHPDGTVKWVAPVPSSLITAVFTAHGFVGGVASKGDVLLFDRSSGALVSNPFSLPAGTPLPAHEPPPGVWQGLMDPERIPSIFAGLVGTGSLVVNTPAVNPRNNRMFITAAGPIVGGVPTGRLYGIDVTAEGQLSLAFTGGMGPGSGTSPVISPDGSAVYAADAVGNMFAFDALTAAPTAPPLWVLNTGASNAAPSVAPDGTLYTLGGGKIISIAPNGVKNWEQNFDAAAQMLPVINDAAAPRKSQANSVISVTAGHVYVTANLGYQLTLSDGTKFVVPAKCALFVLDPETGATVAPPFFVRDVTEGFVTMAAGGSMYITHGATISSIAVNAVIPSLADGPLKTALAQLALKPIGGVSAVSPLSFLDLATAGIQWVLDLDTAALAGLNAGTPSDVDDAYTQVRRGFVQLDATLGSINDAEMKGEIDSRSARQSRRYVQTALTLLDDAKKLIANVRIYGNHALLVSAKYLIHNTDRMLREALLSLP